MTKRNTWLLLGGLAAAGLCCASSVAGLMVVGALSGGGTSATRGEPGVATLDGLPLVGTWTQGSVSLTSYRSLTTGEFAPPSGSGRLYTFNPDGSCLFAGLLQVTTYGCTSSIFTASECTWRLEDHTLTVEHHAGQLRSTMCGGPPKESESKALVRTWRAAITQGEFGRHLELTEGAGAPESFRFQE